MKKEMIQVYNQSRKINVNVYQPDSPKFAAIMLHGMSEHSGRYDYFASRLMDAGGYVLTYDHRGHGIDAENHGDIDSMDALVSDALAVAGHLPKDVPNVIVGHSMGSIVARQLLAMNQFTRFIIIGSLTKNSFLDILSAGALLPLSVISPKSQLEVVNFLALNVNDKLFNGTEKNRWLSSNEENVKSYNDDPLCGFKMTTKAIYDTLFYSQKSLKKSMLARIKNNPNVLFVSGMDDAINNMGKDIFTLAKNYNRAVNDVKVHLYPDARHEVLNEKNRDEVIDNIIDWINDNG
ncbi:MAG TPA: alpha/beta hydrolase [Aliicoccus persicus]|uniref:Alpha/beta hydrolase n=1 Tax=Aliicoccus persicus TaxID=930138 RepID=A0A921JCD2_9STAP|nr:alpha/beta hydrolase [Aliicoccus persicus]